MKLTFLFKFKIVCKIYERIFCNEFERYILNQYRSGVLVASKNSYDRFIILKSASDNFRLRHNSFATESRNMSGLYHDNIGVNPYVFFYIERELANEAHRLNCEAIAAKKNMVVKFISSGTSIEH